MRRLVVILVGALLLSACGSASHSSSASTTHASAAGAERNRLLAKVQASLAGPASPVADVNDLKQCIVQQARGLPLASLRKLAAANVSTSVTNPLVAQCVERGKGLSWVRGVITDVVAGKLPPPIPASFSKCIEDGVGKLTPAQLAAALRKGANGDQAYSRQLGRHIALDCIKHPRVFVQWRKLWLEGIRRSLNGRHLPAAFVECVVGKAAQIGAPELVKLVQSGPAAERAYGEKLGRECRPSPSS